MPQLALQGGRSGPQVPERDTSKVSEESGASIVSDGYLRIAEFVMEFGLP